MNTNELPSDGDEVARLIRLAGMRADAPPDVAARAKGAVRAAWNEKVRRRARRRQVWIGVGLAAAASLILAVGLPIIRPGGAQSSAMSLARVDSLVGQVWTRTAGDTKSEVLLRPGDRVPSASEIVTGPGARVGLTSPDGYSIRLDADTVASVISGRQFELVQGALYFDSGPESVGDADVEVRTPFGIARPIGTQFEVRLGEQSVLVSVREGRVELSSPSGIHEIEEGREVQLYDEGRATRGAVLPYGPKWAWAAQVAPGFDMNGRPLRAMLDWASREGGRQLVFADEATARLASEIILTGSVAGLEIDEALAAVMSTSNLSYRIEDGNLIVSQPEP